MPRQPWKRGVVWSLFVASLALAACAPARIGEAPKARTGDAPQAQASTATVREVTLTASEWRFAPAAIQLTAGQPTRLVLKNDGKILHDVALMGLDAQMADGQMEMGQAGEHAEGATPNVSSAIVHVDAEPGKTGTVEFTPARSGTYRFACTLPGHEQAGMVGQLTVAQGPMGSR